MSELDLSQPSPLPSTGAAAPAAPQGGLELHPPDPVPVVEQEQALGMVVLDPSTKDELARKAAAFAADLAAQEPNSPGFAKKIDDVVRMGAQEIRASSQASNRMLDRPSTSLAAAQGRGPAGDPQARVARSLQDLRDTVTDLDPARADLTGARKILGLIPGGKKITRYFERYASAQSQLDAIINALASGQDELRKDNAAIEQEKAALWTTMGRLAEYATLAAALDDATSAQVEKLRPANPKAADALSADALFAIRQRRQDLLTQIAVSVQGYLALDLIRKNNLELIKGVERAQTTTVAALRTAVVVAQALANQKLVLDQIDALNTTTDAMINRTSELLKQQSGAIYEQASSSGVSVETLQKAFDNVLSTIDAIDAYKAKAVTSMASTVTALEGQVARSRDALDRVRAQEGTGDDPRALPRG